MERLYVDLDQLIVNPAINPRHASDEGVGDLIATIKANGFSDALLVRRTPENQDSLRFEVIDGSRPHAGLERTGLA